MNIKNQIRLSIIISLILVVVISASIALSYQNMQDLREQEALAAEVVRGGYELTYLSNDYLINAEPRARLQWEVRYASLQPIIGKLKPGNPEEAKSLETIREYNEKTGTLFREIPEPGTLSAGPVLFPVSYQQVTWSRINVQSQGMIYDAWRLRHLYNDDVSEAGFWNNILVVVLMVLMLVVIGVNYLLISRRLVRSIREVNTGSEVFAAGNLDYRIPVTSDDEIGGIAHRLNSMAEQLRLVTASRDELEWETQERRQAENEISTQYSIMKGVLESTDSAVFSLDQNYRYTSFNSHHAGVMKLLYGTEIELGRSMFEFQTVPADRTTSQKNIDRALAGEQFTDAAYSGEDERSRRYFEVTHNPVRDTNGVVVGVAVFAKDSTERELARNKLHESTEYLNKLIDFASAPIIVWSPDFTITRFNHAFERLTGRTEQEVIGQQLDILFPEESRAASFMLIRDTVKGDRWESVKIPILASDGTVHTVLWNSANVLTAEAELVSTIAQGVEITESERVVAALEESERKYRNLYHYAQVGLFETSFRDATVIACNQKYADLAGFASIEEAIGKDILGFYVNPEDRTEVGRILREQGHIENHVVRFRNQCTGRQFWGQFSARFNYEREMAEGTIVDVTPQMEAEEKVRNSEAKLRSILDSTPFPVAIVDTEDNNILYWSRSAMEKFGHTAPTAAEWYRIAYPEPEYRQDVANRWKPFLETARKSGQPVNTGEYRVTCRDGSVRICELYAIFLADNLIVTFNDITEKKRAEKALRRSEMRFRTMADWTSDWEYWIDPQKNVVYMSPSVEKITGYPATDFIADHTLINRIVHPDDLPLWDSHTDLIKHPGHQEDTAEVEFRIISRDGEVRWIGHTCRAIFADDGTWAGRRISNRDITDRKESEAELVTAQQQYRDLFESVGIGIIRFTPGHEGSLIEANPAAIRLFEADSREQLLAVRPGDLYVDRNERRRISEEIVAKGAIRSMEIRYKTLQGRPFWGSITSVKKISDDGVVYFDNTIEDITGRKRVEEQLLLKNIVFESSVAANSIADIRGIITHVNPAFLKLWGYRTTEEAIGHSVSSFFVREEDGLSVLEALDTLGRWEGEFLAQKTDGSTFVTQGIATVIRDGNGELIGYQSTNLDITDRNLTEVQREKLIAELEQKNAELERFTYTVSHDLKSPLITIKGFASLLEDDALGGDPLQLKKDIRRITEAAGTMQELLADVLELARAGKIVSPPQKTPFLKIAREAMDLLAGPLAERHVTVDIVPDLPLVYADHARIREVMTNLIGNAVKFFGDQENPVIRIGVDRSGDIPVFFVQDNGIGIDPRYLERIFNLFERLDVSTPGTGIGLTIVRRIIEVHGGKIWAESAGPGKGTTFRFTLPGVPADRDTGVP